MPRINYDLQQLQAFIAVAQRTSFRAAAEDLCLSQSALSRRVENLEYQLGTKLLERTTRRVALTQTGQIFLERARSAMDDLERAFFSVRDLSLRQSARVCIACVPSVSYYFLPAILQQYVQKFPAIRLSVIADTAHLALQSVLTGRADFGIGFLGSQDVEIDFKAILREDFVLAVHQNHPFARKARISWDEVQSAVQAGERLINVSSQSGNRLLVDTTLARHGKRIAGSFEVSHVHGLLGLVEAGLGIAAVPRLAMPILDGGNLVAVKLHKPRIYRTLGLISRRGNQLGHAAGQLYEMVQHAAKPAKA